MIVNNVMGITFQSVCEEGASVNFVATAVWRNKLAEFIQGTKLHNIFSADEIRNFFNAYRYLIKHSLLKVIYAGVGNAIRNVL